MSSRSKVTRKNKHVLCVVGKTCCLVDDDLFIAIVISLVLPSSPSTYIVHRYASSLSDIVNVIIIVSLCNECLHKRAAMTKLLKRQSRKVIVLWMMHCRCLIWTVSQFTECISLGLFQARFSCARFRVLIEKNRDSFVALFMQLSRDIASIHHATGWQCLIDTCLRGLHYFWIKFNFSVICCLSKSIAKSSAIWRKTTI